MNFSIFPQPKMVFLSLDLSLPFQELRILLFCCQESFHAIFFYLDLTGMKFISWVIHLTSYFSYRNRVGEVLDFFKVQIFFLSIPSIWDVAIDFILLQSSSSKFISYKEHHHYFIFNFYTQQFYFSNSLAYLKNLYSDPHKLLILLLTLHIFLQ